MERTAIFVGLIASLISILSFATGITALPDWWRVGTPPARTAGDGPTSAGTDAPVASDKKWRLEPEIGRRFGLVGRLVWAVFRWILVLGAPLLPAALFWRLADEMDWEIDFEAATKAVTGTIYGLGVLVLFTIFFPTTLLGRGLLHVAEWMMS
jgi:hypothetical protein